MIDDNNQPNVDQRGGRNGQDGSTKSVDALTEAIDAIKEAQINIDIKNAHLMTDDELLEAERASRAWATDGEDTPSTPGV
jgi:hypothetical protein